MRDKYPSIPALVEACKACLTEYFAAATANGGRGLVPAYEQAHDALTASACLGFLDQYRSKDGQVNRSALVAEVGSRAGLKKYLTRAIHDGAKAILATLDEEARLASVKAAQAEADEPKPEKADSKAEKASKASKAK